MVRRVSGTYTGAAVYVAVLFEIIHYDDIRIIEGEERRRFIGDCVKPAYVDQVIVLFAG